MKQYTDLEYLKLGKLQAFWYNVKLFFWQIPSWLKKFALKVWSLFLGLGSFLTGQIKDIGYTFIKGNWAVKLSFLVFGLGNLYYGQILRGVLFLLFEIVFLVYMFLPEGGIHWITKAQFFQTGNTIGTVGPTEGKDVIYLPGIGNVEQSYTIFGDDAIYDR